MWCIHGWRFWTVFAILVPISVTTTDGYRRDTFPYAGFYSSRTSRRANYGSSSNLEDNQGGNGYHGEDYYDDYSRRHSKAGGSGGQQQTRGFFTDLIDSAAAGLSTAKQFANRIAIGALDSAGAAYDAAKDIGNHWYVAAADTAELMTNHIYNAAAASDTALNAFRASES